MIECSKWEGEISIECKREKGLSEIDRMGSMSNTGGNNIESSNNAIPIIWTNKCETALALR